MSLFAGPSRTSHGSTVATYRNPLRTIAHCDIDGAFAQFEQVRLGLPDDVPLICSQWGAIIAVNYPARAYGIKRMHNAEDAKKLCPHLVVQHVATYRDGDSEAGYWDDVDRRTHKVSLDPYRRESLKILAIFREMVPRGELEKASIDEAFMDLTIMVVERLLERFPYLQAVPDDAPDGVDSPLPPPPPIDWSKAGHIVPARNGAGGEGEAGEAGEGEEEEGEDTPVTWGDWALCLGAEIMADTRAEVWKRLHYTCSAGIGHNKTLAKICSGWKKPNQQTVLRLSATPGFMRDMDFTDIRFLGGKLGNAIAEEYHAKTVGDMLPVSLEDMQSKFGEESIWVYNILRGIDHTEVKEKLATKSMLASKNTIPNVTSQAQGYHWLAVLAGELSVRLREARGVAPGLWPKTLVLSTRTGWDSRSRQLPFPFSRELDTAYIVKHAKRLWDEHVPQKGFKFNNISLSFTGLEKLEEGQQGIEGFFTAKRPREGGSNGTVMPKRPRPTHTEPESKPEVKATPLESFLRRRSDTSAEEAKVEAADATGTVKAEEEGKLGGEELPPPDLGARWTCPRCAETLSVPDGIHPEEGESWLARQRAEHEDWHFAADLQAQYGDAEQATREASGSREATPSRSASASTQINGRRGGGGGKKKAEGGIRAFFAPRK